uniref:Uncharacterized protein n=1 Tax=Anopheles culicifacies TaxID=139723 RepID=A0A182M3N3_9DIPT
MIGQERSTSRLYRKSYHRNGTKIRCKKKKLCPISSHPPIDQSVMQANGMKTVGRRSLTVPRTKSVKSFDILQPHPRVAIHVGLHQKAKLFLIGKIAHMIRVSGG